MSPLRVPRALLPLRHRAFRLLAAGQLASNVGDAFYAVALPWYVLATHGGALLLGTVLAAYGVPRTVLLAVGGHAADRWKPWNVMMAADSVRALAVGGLAVVAALGPARADLLVPVAVVLGAGEGLFLPGSSAIVPALVPDEDLQAGNALSAGGTELAMLVGPALGGAVVALVGPAPAFGVDALTFCVSAGTLLAVRATRRLQPGALVEAPPEVAGPAPEPTSHAPGSASAAPGAEPGQAAPPMTLRRVLRTERVLQVILLVTLAANLGSGGLGEVALPALAHGPFHTGATGYGGLIAALGAGAVAGTLLAAQLRRSRRPALVASFAFLAQGACIAAVPFLGGPLPAVAPIVLFGVLNGFGNVLTITAFQRWAPSELLGRLTGLVMFASMGVFPVSVLFGAAVVRTLGPAAFFPMAAGIVAVAVLAGLTQRSWRTFGAPEDGDQPASASSSSAPAPSPASATTSASPGSAAGT